MPVFSIIIPVYNAESTLAKCLDSLKAQSFRDFHAIMVENGSKDRSAEICREYAMADARFELVSMPDNCGPSGARNTGLDRANGQYIAFVDSDDYVAPEYLAQLKEAFERENTDVVFFGYHQYAMDGTDLGEHIPVIAPELSYHQILTELHRQDLFGYTWIKAFRAEIIGSQRFSKELNLLEDEVFACQVLATPRRISVIPFALYHYIIGNSGSLVGRTHPDYCHKVDMAYGAWKVLLQSYDKKDEVLTAMANSHVSRCMYYGFERDLDMAQFFRDLAETEFFWQCNLDDRFCTCVRNGDIATLNRMRRVYSAKTIIAKWLKR